MGDNSQRVIADFALVVIRHAPTMVHEIAAWPGAEAALNRFVETHASGATRHWLSVGPGRFWIIGADTPDLEQAANGLALVDLSNALSCIRLSGPSTRLVLRKGLPIDLHPAVFPAGSVATSAIENIVVTVYNRGDSLDLFCRRSFTGSLEHWLADAALEFLN